MRVETALVLINESLVFLPNWTIEATDHRKRYEDAICLRLTIKDAPFSEREEAPKYLRHVPNGVHSEFPIHVGDCNDIDELAGRVLDAILDTFAHEAREFLRIKPTMWAPFHPHKRDGIDRWTARTGRHPDQDFKYGIV